MKKIILLLITTLFCLHTIGQTKNEAEQYPIDSTKNYYLGNIDLARITVGLMLDTLANVRSYANSFPNISNKKLTYVENGNRAQLSIQCRLLSDIKNYQFVVKDDHENALLSGSAEGLTFTNDPIFGYSAKLPVIDIQKKVISITLYNKTNPAQQGTAIIYNKTLPRTEIAFLGTEVNTREPKGISSTMSKDCSEITLGRDSRGLKASIRKNDYNFIYSILIKKKKTGDAVFKSRTWIYDYPYAGADSGPEIFVDKQYFKTSGEYEIIIQPDLKYISEKELEQYSSKKTIYVDIVKSYSAQELILWSILLLIICMGTTSLLIYLIRRKNRQKVKNENLQKKIAEARLSSIQSQLNPHFLFNALSSIQSFINDNDVDNANRYLSKFARLTRHVLDSSTSTSLIDEINLLEDYLQMEQLRFGFQYKIQAKNLDSNNIEIPSMLLQPLVENAIKHGVAEQKEQGQVNIDFDRDKNDLRVTIVDNGNGYNVKQVVTGLGIKLTNERIELWNELHSQAPISLTTISNSKGTSVYLTFKNWLS